jgi:hypothetical protein
MGPLSVADIAARAGKSDEWVKQQARAGLLPGRKFGRTWAFTEADWSEFLERCRFKPQTATGRRTRAAAAETRRANHNRPEGIPA